jgi:hypothetical protein
MNKRIGILMMLCVLLAAMLLMPTLGGCSPSIQSWVDRGEQGIAFAKANQIAWYGATVAQLDKDRKAAIQAVFNDTINAMRAGVATPASTQPVLGGPITRPVDTDWIITQEKLLLATMDAFDVKKSNLDSQNAICLSNLDKTNECFAEVQKLNVAWANSSQAIQDQLASLQTTVQAIAQSQATASAGK